MNKTLKSFLLWTFAILFTLSLAVYQRLTGPTHPVRGSIEINDTEIKYKLLRSAENHQPAIIKIKGVGEGISGIIKYKRFKVEEEWTERALRYEDGNLIAELPQQPMAGKLEYMIKLFSNGTEYVINETPVVIRFKGAVPRYILWPHIFFMFLAMLWSTRTGLDAIFKSPNTKNMAFITMMFLLVGGMILGPFVQKYAFDAFWTGWPFGKDLTDNKTLVAFIAWVIAYLRLRKNGKNTWWALAAAIILLMVYLIPHSMFGSELDVSSGKVVTG
jgi:hypothetical protein